MEGVRREEGATEGEAPADVVQGDREAGRVSKGTQTEMTKRDSRV